MPASTPRLSGSSRLLIDDVCTRFEQAWSAGNSRRIEDCLGEVSADLASELVLELVALELELRSSTGHQSRLEDYLARFPSFTDSVQRAFSEWQQDSLNTTAQETTLPPNTRRRSATPQGYGKVQEQLQALVDALNIPGYSIRGVLGSGGMGVVVRAWDEKLHRDVAIKLLLPEFSRDPRSRQRFLCEARASAAIRHPNVVTIHAVEDDHDPPYLVLELVEGGTLADRLASTKTLELNEVLRLTTDMAEGLAAAHARGIVHRDIKPGNVLIETGDGRARLTDFGLARALTEHDITTTGSIAGTPQFMSPEQIEGREIDHRSDLFSLGAVLYRMVTGQPAFHGESVITLARRICDQEPRSVAEVRGDVPEWLTDIIQRLLAKRPEDRIQSANELVQLLQAGSSQKTSSAKRPSRLRSSMIVSVAVLVLITLWYGTTRPLQESATNSTSQASSPVVPAPPPPLSNNPPAKPVLKRPSVVRITAENAKQIQKEWSEYLGLPIERDVDLSKRQRLTLVLIPPGEFLMGADLQKMAAFVEAESAKRNAVYLQNNLPAESPQHLVRITRPFYLSKCEISQVQWRAVMARDHEGAEFRGSSLPVDHVSWNDAQDFLEQLNQHKTSEDLAFGLPTEAQWEFACRAGSESVWHFGDNHETDLPLYAWFETSSGCQNHDGESKDCRTHRVGELLPNDFGLHDMHGNVWEHCSDWYASDAYANSTIDDPVGPPTGTEHVARGGSFRFWWAFCRSTMRGHDPPARRFHHGVRVAATISHSKLEILASRNSEAGLQTVSNILTSPDWEWSQPEHLGAAVNSSAAESSPSLSADGKLLAFVSRRTGEPLPYLAERNSIDEPFHPAEPAAIDLSPWPAVRDVAISSDALTLLIALGSTPQTLDLHQSTRPNPQASWSKPELLVNVNSPKSEFSPKLSADGLRLVFHSDREQGVGLYDLWEARRSSVPEVFGEPVLLTPPVSSTIAEENPILTSDNLGVFFTRDWNNPRLLFCTRVTKEAPFHEPQPVTIPGITSAHYARAPALTADGQQMIFGSNLPGGLGASDLWLTRRVRRAQSTKN